MSTGVCVFAGVAIRRTVAAQRDSTCLARPQMNPIAADLHTFFAFAALWLFDRLNRIQMGTASAGHSGKAISQQEDVQRCSSRHCHSIRFGVQPPT